MINYLFHIKEALCSLFLNIYIQGSDKKTAPAALVGRGEKQTRFRYEERGRSMPGNGFADYSGKSQARLHLR